MIDFDIQRFEDIKNSTNYTTVTGTADNDDILNYGSHVTIIGFGGNDSIVTFNTSYVSISGGAGDDTVINRNYNLVGNFYEYNNGDGNDVIVNLKSNDYLIINGNRREITRENDGDIVIEVGSNSITIQKYTIVDYYKNNTTITGTAYSDNIEHFNGSNVTIIGGDGNDNLQNFYSENVTMSGGAGDDTLINLSPNVSMSGGDGNDFIEILDVNVTINGGAGGNDTLVGGAGYDEFIFGLGSGGDVIQNAGDNDLINLSGVTLNQITGLSASESSVNISLSDGSYLNVEGNSKVGYKIENAVFACDQSTGNWYAK